MFLSFQEIVDKEIEYHKDNQFEADYLLSFTKDELISLHHSYGNFIRNEYELWDEKNPLTENYTIDIKRHPDQISFNIIFRVWEYLYANL